MGLYLCVFDDDDEELDGVEVGAYSDFNQLRDTVSAQLENGKWGTRFPTLMMHSDCDGEWTSQECGVLTKELTQIVSELKTKPPIEMPSDWQRKVARSVGLVPTNAFESFIDVDGEPLLDRILFLAKLSADRGFPILFQ